MFRNSNLKINNNYAPIIIIITKYKATRKIINLCREFYTKLKENTFNFIIPFNTNMNFFK